MKLSMCSFRGRRHFLSVCPDNRAHEDDRNEQAQPRSPRDWLGEGPHVQDIFLPDNHLQSAAVRRLGVLHTGAARVDSECAFSHEPRRCRWAAKVTDQFIVRYAKEGKIA